MGKHTPGPWYFSKAENCIARGEKNGDVRIAYLDDNSTEDRANAQLIAAAPELLGRLEKMQQVISELASMNPFLRNEFEKNRAVIARATRGDI